MKKKLIDADFEGLVAAQVKFYNEGYCVGKREGWNSALDVVRKKQADLIVPALLNMGLLNTALQLVSEIASARYGDDLRNRLTNGKFDDLLSASFTKWMGHSRELGIDITELSLTSVAPEYIVAVQKIINGASNGDELRVLTAKHKEDLARDIAKITDRLAATGRPKGMSPERALIDEQVEAIIKEEEGLTIRRAAEKLLGHLRELREQNNLGQVEAAALKTLEGFKDLEGGVKKIQSDRRKLQIGDT